MVEVGREPGWEFGKEPGLEILDRGANMPVSEQNFILS